MYDPVCCISMCESARIKIRTKLKLLRFTIEEKTRPTKFHENCYRYYSGIKSFGSVPLIVFAIFIFKTDLTTELRRQEIDSSPNYIICNCLYKRPTLQNYSIELLATIFCRRLNLYVSPLNNWLLILQSYNVHSSMRK